MLALMGPGFYFGVWSNPGVRLLVSERLAAYRRSEAVLPSSPSRAAHGPATAAPAPTAVVTVTSDPAGAAVLDATTRAFIGWTPVEVPIPFGHTDVQVTLEKQGYKTKAATITLRDRNGLWVKMERRNHKSKP